jgi:hypothetical protein
MGSACSIYERSYECCTSLIGKPATKNHRRNENIKKFLKESVCGMGCIYLTEIEELWWVFGNLVVDLQVCKMLGIYVWLINFSFS